MSAGGNREKLLEICRKPKNEIPILLNTPLRNSLSLCPGYTIRIELERCGNNQEGTRRAHNPEVAGSNPTPATILFFTHTSSHSQRMHKLFFLLLFRGRE